ncbi:MAG: class I SAM-dependent methyltransferase [Thermoanaerobaculia bacterium]
MDRSLRQRLRMLRHEYDLGRGAGGGRACGLRHAAFSLWADSVRRSRPLARDWNALTEADLCRHEEVRTVRFVPRLIVRCRRCGVAFATMRDDLAVATERHDGAYFRANRDFVYPDGKPDIFSYVMPRTLFFLALGMYAFRPDNRRALDVGCGIGIMVRYLRFLGFDAEGVEISEDGVEYARRELGLEKIRQGTVQEAAYPDASFGLVTLVHVVEHLDDPVPVLREVFRILEPGGFVYVELPCSERDTSDYYIDDHFWFYSPDSLRLLLSCVGFRDVRVGEGTFDPRLHNVPFLFAAGRRPLDSRGA